MPEPWRKKIPPPEKPPEDEGRKLTPEDEAALWESLGIPETPEYARYAADLPAILWLMNNDPEWALFLDDPERAIKTWLILSEQHKQYFRNLQKAQAEQYGKRPAEAPTALVDKNSLPRFIIGPDGERIPVKWGSHIIYRDARNKRHILYLPIIPPEALNENSFKQLMEQAYGNRWEEWALSKEDKAGKEWGTMEAEQANLLTFPALLQAVFYNAVAAEAGKQGISPDQLPAEASDWALNKAMGGPDLYGGIRGLIGAVQQPVTPMREPAEKPYLSPVVREALYRQELGGPEGILQPSYNTDLTIMERAFESMTPMQLTSGEWWNPKVNMLQTDKEPGEYPHQGGTLKVYSGGQAYFIPTRRQWAGVRHERLEGTGKAVLPAGPIPFSFFQGLEIPYSDIQRGHLIEGPQGFYIPGQQYSLSVAEIEGTQKMPLPGHLKNRTYSPQEVAVGIGPGSPLVGFFNQQGQWVEYNEETVQSRQKGQQEAAARQQAAQSEEEWKKLLEQSRRPTPMKRF